MEAALARKAATRSFSRRRFLEKIISLLMLVSLADQLFFLEEAGSTLALFGSALMGAVLLLNSAARRRDNAFPIGFCLLFLLALADDPSLLAFTLFWAALAMLALLPRGGFDDGFRWGLRLMHHGLRSLFAPIGNWRRLATARRRHGRLGWGRHLRLAWLPLLGTSLFLALFAAANPLIGNALARIDLVALLASLSFVCLAFWIVVGMAIWPMLRPHLLLLAPQAHATEPFVLPGVSAGSVTLSLLAFNLLFAAQNGLDLAFLWSGAPLPQGVTLADYAHRGAYPLIATALLAGLFVLVTLSPSAPLARSRAIRNLVSLWIAQNVLLVASTILRTIDYVDAYSLTRLRIAALLWMALVAVGLVLICWRIWRKRSAAWLINANLAAALLVLGTCSFVDLGAAAAWWNIAHAREVGGRGSALDLCYIGDLGAPALLPMIALESRPLASDFRQRVAWKRNELMDRIELEQTDWHGWTFRDARRLEAARRLIAERHLPRFAADRRSCDGSTTLTPPGKG